MDRHIVFDAALTRADRVVLSSMADDVRASTKPENGQAVRSSGSETTNGFATGKASATTTLLRRGGPDGEDDESDKARVAALKAMNDPKHADFEPSIISAVDLCDMQLPPWIEKNLLRPYVSLGRKLVRVETDVIMLTHLLIYLCTSVPSVAYLFYRFTYAHAALHVAMTFYYTGAYTLMMHQHIHMRGVLAKRLWFIDHAFPYVLDPMMGHTWNTYFYHHVKHHHVEGNGPDDLSSTMRYQRDDLLHFLHYVGRFYFFVWLDLPLYFVRKNRPAMAVKAAASEFGTYTFYYLMSRIDGRATFFAYLLPLFLLRFGLMVGNWGQHAFVDQEQPDSDFRSSITLIDVPVSTILYFDGHV